MNGLRSSRGFVFVLAAAVQVLQSMPALATAQRTFVASYGSDANPCSMGQPCRTFAAAIAQAGGDAVALDSAG
jgi:hypothetical protein